MTTLRGLTFIPYHDWRKIKSEGGRTRDAHFINSFRENADVEKLIILNRPTTLAELILKKKTFKSKLDYKIMLSEGGCRLYQIDHKTFLIDFVLKESILQILLGRSWFSKSYGNRKVLNFYIKCISHLNLINTPVVSANIFAYQFFRLSDINVIFDAWDNFYLMPALKNIQSELKKAYQSMANVSPYWTTNSEENKNFYTTNYHVKNVEVIKNGVDLGVFDGGADIPFDLKEIKQKGNKIAGFGGKITHLFDVEMFNYIVNHNPEINFVIIGQILDKDIFSKITKADNVFYLGDKHYDIYPNYIMHLDIGIIPYKINEHQHGGDSIKAYEYLAAGLTVVGTRGNGLEFLGDYINIADTKEQFSELLTHPKEKLKFPAENYSWSGKSQLILNKLLDESIFK